jgi:murein DD-endopeptidase MepM/ murein hydrolase activator NlpD
MRSAAAVVAWLRRRRTLAFAGGGLALAVLVGVVAGSAVPPGAPPRLYVEVSDQPLAGRPLDVFVSVDVPAIVRVRYADIDLEHVAQDLRVSLLAEAGAWPLTIEAEDAAGRLAKDERVIQAVWPPRPRLEAPATVTVGDPLTVRLTWSSGAGVEPSAAVDHAAIELAGASLVGWRVGDGLTALTSLPLQAEPGSRPLRGVVIDEFGFSHEVHGSVRVAANPNPVQELDVAAATLAVVTPEGRELEAAALAKAFAAVGPEPRWQEPFVLPVDGRHTSAFGLPRRYTRGGPVSHHLGTDIAAPTGTPILATNHGVVRVAGMYPIKGGLTVLDHGFGVSSLYFHQSVLVVGVGDVVERGQVIGFVGSTGLSTGPHLHWEMRVDGVPTAPLAWVDRRWPGAPLEPAVGGE